jgi:hypothetical protein
MFPLEFPFRCLAGAAPGDWVLDPFCGRGTTNLAARLRGLRSVGVDSNPVAAAIAAAKLAHVTPEGVIELARAILNENGTVATPAGEFWELCYHPNTLVGICRLRQHLLARCSSEIEIALRALLLGVLHGPTNKGLPTYLSAQMPRTYSTKPAAAVRYWRKKGLSPSRIEVLDVISRRARFSFSALPPKVAGKVIAADTRKLDLRAGGRRFKWVITSPPYYGMRSYFPDQWLRNWFLGGADTVEYIHDGQVPQGGEAPFLSGLARVWKRVAGACLDGARLVVRFGALPSVRKDPRSLLTRSLAMSGAGWRVTTIKDAGSACSGKRQCGQFKRGVNTAINEIDLYARLEA